MIRGKNDWALLAGMFKNIDRYLADARVVEIDDCSHWVQHDAPDVVNSEIQEMLQAIGQYDE